MDATPASANGNGFDAALKALEELDTTPAVEPVVVIPAGSILALDDAPAEPGPEAPAVTVTLEDAPDPAPATPEAVAEPEPGPAPAAVHPGEESVQFLGQVTEAPAAADAEAEPPAPVAAPVPDIAVAKAAAAPSSRLTKIAIGLGLCSSLLSAVGLIVAERTIMSAQLVVADAREKQQQIEHATRLIKELEELRAKQVELIARQQAQAASGAVTSAELQYRMDALQAGLVARDPVNKVVEAVNSGKAENNARFHEFGMKMARIEAFMERESKR